MGRNKEDIQDRITLQMEKISKRSDRNSDTPSLAEQLAQRAKYEKLSDEQKRAATPYNIWLDHLLTFMVDKKRVTSHSRFRIIVSKFKKDIEAFHSSGIAFSGMLRFFEEKSNILLNDNR